MRHLIMSGTALLAVAYPIHAQDGASPPSPSLHLTFGAYSFKKATEVYKQFQPATEELSKLLTTRLGESALVELAVSKTYEACLADLVAGRIDLARVGPASYVIAKQQNPKVQLIAAEREDSRGVGLIVVREDSPIHTLADLKGKKFAFGDDQSTIGRFLSQAELVRGGVFAKDLAAYQYLQRHDIVFKAVEIGDYDAGALHLDTFNELNKKAQHRLRVLHAFDNVPKPWVLRAGLEPRLVTAVQQSLLCLQDPAALKALKVPGLRAADDAEFDLIREGMAIAERFAPEAGAAPATPPAPTPVPAKE